MNAKGLYECKRSLQVVRKGVNEARGRVVGVEGPQEAELPGERVQMTVSKWQVSGWGQSWETVAW